MRRQKEKSSKEKKEVQLFILNFFTLIRFLYPYDVASSFSPIYLHLPSVSFFPCWAAFVATSTVQSFEFWRNSSPVHSSYLYTSEWYVPAVFQSYFQGTFYLGNNPTRKLMLAFLQIDRRPLWYFCSKLFFQKTFIYVICLANLDSWQLWKLSTKISSSSLPPPLSLSLIWWYLVLNFLDL